MRNLRLDICYDGTRYRGWQRLNGVDQTIQGKLETVLSRVLGEDIEVLGSGRTDAGVHALNQVANFHCHSDMPAVTILEQLRRYLPDDIGIYSCTEVSERFHARYNAQSKVYRYRIWNSELPCVFEHRFVTVFPDRLDLDAMKLAASSLCGTHDFSAFCTNKHMKKSTVRQIFKIDIQPVGEEIHISFCGNGFLHNMVRILVGTLLEVGTGKRSPDSMPGLFGKKREESGFIAPPQGLCLMEVHY